MPPHPNEVIETVFAHNRITNKDFFFISYLIKDKLATASKIQHKKAEILLNVSL